MLTDPEELIDVFQDKVVVVTGSSRGIGQATAIEFARLGAKVVSVARGVPHHIFPGTLDETEQVIRGFGGEVTSVQADLMEEADIQRIHDETMAAYGRCDILVNNAAASFLGSFLDLSLKRLDIIWKVNVRASWQLSQLFLPQMLERGYGRIVNVSSGAGHVDYSGASWADVQAPASDGVRRMGVGQASLGAIAYGTSKSALDRFTQGLAGEVAGQGVAVNAIGVEARTPPNVHFITDDESPQGELPEAPAQIITWLAAQPPELTGRILSQHVLLEPLRAAGLVRPAARPGDNPDLPSGSSGMLPKR
ncbi:MAG: SDR family NAD(P)-dependent oxidoreductase [Candidatus Nanopelagicales bacterium]|nr:SDR family NAD(P)-dependent oxidoreductase [Candidatus Nanopelagicales bacterium]